MSIFQKLTDDEIDEFINNFMNVNFGDNWDENPGFSLICPEENKMCPKCKGNLEKKTSTSFNGEKFDVLKCSNCGHCE